MDVGIKEEKTMPAVDGLADIEILSQEYELVRRMVYDRAGINLGDNRQHLVQARLAKRIRIGGFENFREYFKFLESDTSGDEIGHLIDAISTNTTFFFRERDHFDFLAASLSDRILQEKWNQCNYMLRIWSAASSSGEEPYSLAMVVHHLLKDYPQIDFKLLATDISQKVLAQACAGRYDADKIKSIPDEYRSTCVKPVDRTRTVYEIVPQIRNYISFAHFNLVQREYPFRFGFDYVFCRNVMIYFDRETQQSVVNRISQHIRPGGFLIVGHSESLNGLKHDLQYIKPTIYRKRA